MSRLLLRRMNSEEFTKFCQFSYDHFVCDLASSSGQSVEEVKLKSGGPPFTSEKDLWYVIELEKEEVGFFWIQLLQEKPGVAFGYDIYLSPEFRGRGLGRQTLLEARKILQEIGVKTLEICTFADNQAALSLYRSLGFREISFNEARKQYRLEIVV